MFTPGTLLSNRYRLDHPLGEGGMGEVWSATDELLRRKVAIKLLKVPASPSSGEAATERRRLLREARAASAVQHAGVVRILDVVEAGEVAYLVMELLDGASLRKHLEHGPLDAGTTCAIMVQVARAVRAAHEKGIVHRDLKPENIFLLRSDGGPGAVKVLDFGIAKLLPDGGATATENLTRTGHILGSPPYMSPEQTFGEEDIDHRTDLWSFGIVLYECLTGVLPTRGANTGQIFKIITKKGVRPIEEVLPDIPPRLARLLGRLLAQDREERPADLGEAIEILEEHASAAGAQAPTVLSSLDSSASHVVSVQGPRPSPDTAPAPSLATADTELALPQRRSRSAWVAALGALAALVAAGAALGLRLPGEAGQEPPAALASGLPALASGLPAPATDPPAPSLVPGEPAPTGVAAEPRTEDVGGGTGAQPVSTAAAVTAAARPLAPRLDENNVYSEPESTSPAAKEPSSPGAAQGGVSGPALPTVAAAPASAPTSAGGYEFDTFPAAPSPSAPQPPRGKGLP